MAENFFGTKEENTEVASSFLRTNVASLFGSIKSIGQYLTDSEGIILSSFLWNTKP